MTGDMVVGIAGKLAPIDDPGETLVEEEEERWEGETVGKGAEALTAGGGEGGGEEGVETTS